jgi:2,3-bisphosphoglycerate-dependent phosphoglycerate mutase
MATTRLLFVRHGESAHTVAGTVGGPRTCRGLTDRGRAQAAALAARLAPDLDGASVYSSTLPRAVETAHAFGLPVTQDCGLCTWHVPDWMDGLTAAELRANRLPGGGVFRPFEEGNESWVELVARVGRSIMDIAARHRGGTALLVCHNETVDASFRALGQLPLYPQFDVAVGPATVTEWSTDADPAGWPPARWTMRRAGA